MDQKFVILNIFLSIFFTFFFHFMFRCVIQRRRQLQRQREALAFLYATTNVIRDEFRPQSPNALDPTILASLPKSNYKKSTLPNENSSQSCSICLCEVDEGEMVRVLPNCKHLFHIGCIDMWLYSHSTCPICRAPVAPKEAIVIIEQEENSTTSQHPHGSSTETVDVTNSRPTNTSSEPNGRRSLSSSTFEVVLRVDNRVGDGREDDLERQ